MMFQVRRLKRAALAATGAMAIACVSTSAAAQTRIFDVPAQRAATAVSALAKQAGVQILLPGRTGGNIRTRAVRGDLSVEQALEAMLAGTGLRAMKTGAQTYTIVRETSSRTENAELRDAASADEDAEIVVTGSRIARLAGEDPSPVVRYDRQAIDELGVTDVADIFDYLPQNSTSIGEDFFIGGLKTVQLRGLGIGTTLVLINGRRAVTSGAQGNRNVFDLNTIPLAAVERVEILSDSASAVYGADAIGGVVNLILKDRADRPNVNFYYGGADGGGEEMRGSIVGGVSSDTARLMVGADYFRRDYLHGTERERFFDQNYTRFPGGSDYRSTASNPGNVFALSGNLPGLTSNQAGVPAGSDGIGLTPADFLATQGAANLNRESLRAFQSVVPESRRLSLFANASADLAPWATLFAETLYTHREENRQLAPTTLSSGQISNTLGVRSGIIVPATNPFNPFGVPVRVNYLFEDVGPREERLDEDFFRLVGGVRGDIGHGWSYEIALLHTNDKADIRTSNEVDPARVIAALASTDPATALNLFADGPAGSPQLLRSLVGDPEPNRFISKATQISGFVAGDLFDLPGGGLSVVVGGEYRREAILYDIPSSGVKVDRDRKSSALFAEALIPIISPDMGVSAINRLALTAAGRYDHYSDFGGTFNPKLGIEYQPVRDLLLRASWGTSYRAPSLFELYFEPIQLTGQFVDPLRPPNVPGASGEVTLITLTSGGNPDLKPEEAESFTIGGVWEPRFLPGFNLTIDYFDIEQNLRVASPNATTLLLNADLFPGRVTRAPQTPEEAAAGILGRLLALDTSRLNLGRVETSGIDLRMSYQAKTHFGTITPSVAVTWVDSYKIADFPDLPLQEKVGIAYSEGTVPEYKAVASLGFKRGGLGLSGTLRYVSGYRDFSVRGTSLDRRIPEQYYVDAQVSYTFGEKGGREVLDGLTLRVGAINLFDRKVAYSDINIIGYDPSQSDIRGRFLYGSVSKSF